MALTQESFGTIRTSEDLREGRWVEGRTAGEAQRGTAILAVTLTDHRLEACAPFLRRRPMGNLPHRDTATSKRPKGSFSQRHSGHG
jgi:hypothetical protein